MPGPIYKQPLIVLKIVLHSFCVLLAVYGMTEFLVATSCQDNAIQLGSCGQVADNVAIKVCRCTCVAY